MSESLSVLGVDFHCHLDLYPNFEVAIAKAEAARIFTLTVTTTPMAWPRNFKLTRSTHYVRAALGLHPQLVAERSNELILWERYLPETRFVGEVGLDAGPRFYKSFDVQKKVFCAILQRCADAGDKILTVHSARCVSTVLDLIERYYPLGRGRVVLHWFTGTKSEAQRAISLGCYFSINSEMLRSDRGQRLAVNIPLNRILTETDGPFTNGSLPSSGHNIVDTTVNTIARIYKVPTTFVTEVMSNNLHFLLGE